MNPPVNLTDLNEQEEIFRVFRSDLRRLPTDVTDTRFIDDANTTSIGTQFPLRKVILLHLPQHNLFPAPAAESTSHGNLLSAPLTQKMREGFFTPGALHLLLLEMETSNETVNLPFIPFQFMEEPLGLFVWEETIQIIIFPGE